MDAKLQAEEMICEEQAGFWERSNYYWLNIQAHTCTSEQDTLSVSAKSLLAS